MSRYSLSHLPDSLLLRELTSLVARERATTAALLAHLAEVDARRLYAPAGHPSMFSYCVQELHFSEGVAFKRIRAARTARQFPQLFPAVAEGRLHLSAVVLLAPHLTPENSDELLAAATYKSKAEVERLLAERFPRPDLPERIEPLTPAPAMTLPEAQLAPGPVEGPALQLAPGPVELCAPGRVEAAVAPAKLAPLSPQRYALQVTISQRTHDDLRYAQSLLGHQFPSGNLAQVLERAVRAYVRLLERRKFAATSRPRRSRRPSGNPRHIPAQVKRAVWERDGGRCTFVSEAGQRCPARKMLEFDHVEELARGGRSTVSGIRLLCRVHNQYAAERTFGSEFMRGKREAARAATAARRQEAAVRAAEEARRRAAARAAEAQRAREAAEQARAEEEARRQAAAERARAAAEVIPYLRHLGFRADEARRAAARCESVPDAPLEERVRLALTCFAKPPQGRGVRAVTMPTSPA